MDLGRIDPNLKNIDNIAAIQSSDTQFPKGLLQDDYLLALSRAIILITGSSVNADVLAAQLKADLQNDISLFNQLLVLVGADTIDEVKLASLNELRSILSANVAAGKISQRQADNAFAFVSVQVDAVLNAAGWTDYQKGLKV